jgi:hypothetical protein
LSSLINSPLIIIVRTGQKKTPPLHPFYLPLLAGKMFLCPLPQGCQIMPFNLILLMNIIYLQLFYKHPLYTLSSKRSFRTTSCHVKVIPTRGNLFPLVRLLVWADGRGTVAQADSAARAELQGAPKQKLLQLKNIQKYHWVKHKEMLICCLDVSPDM